MIVYFLLIILAFTVSGDDNDNSDTEYIKTLPAGVRKGILDKVARRILNEVPEVNSGADDINGDVLAEKLESQSEFVKKILKQEVESLKTKRRYFQKLKKFRKSGNDNHQLSGMADSENDTLFSDVKITASDKIDADVGHIDLTLRSGRSKRGDSGINDNDNTTEYGTTENKDENHDGEFVPVAIKLDSGNEDSEPITDSNGNTTEVLKLEEASDDDIQIRNTKQNDDKEIEIVKETPGVITANAENVNETSTQSGLDIKTTFNNENTSIKIHFGKKTEDLDLNGTQGLANTVTVEVSTISNSLSTSLNDTKSPEDNTTPNAFDTTVADVKASSSETDDDEKHKTDRLFKYSSESYLENPVIDNKARKNLNVLESKQTSTLQIEEALLKSEPHLNNTSVYVTEEPLKHYSEITTLITTEAPYVATTTANQPSIIISTEIDSNARTDHQKEPINLETTEKTRKDENILIVSETTTATNADKPSTNEEVRNSSKVLDAKYIKTNDKKPCNETSSKLGVITDCDKKRNKTENTTTEINNVNKAKKTDNVSKVKATVNAEETAVKTSLRTVKKKPLYDSLLHFGDMQIKREYEVHEVDSGKPAFVSQNEEENNERNGIEQPRYAPVYNYDPKNAYFNAYNRLGPNEHDKDDDSESSEPGNENILRTKNIRMSKYISEQKRKNNYTDTTKPYFSKESSCEDSKSKENKEKNGEVFVLPESHEVGHLPYTNKINYLSHVRQNYFKNQVFGYVPTQKEKDKKFSSVAKYLYNDPVSSSSKVILENEGAGKKYLRINDDDKYIERDDASEYNSNTGEDTKDKKQIEVVVLDMNENKLTVLRQGYYSSRYKWDEEGNSFTDKGKVYNLEHIVPYFTEKSIIRKQRQESNKIYDRIQKLHIQNKTNRIQKIMMRPEPLYKTLDHFKSLDMNKTLFNKTSVYAMIDRMAKYANLPGPNARLIPRTTTPASTTQRIEPFVPFSTEKYIIFNQIQESNKTYNRIKNLDTQSENQERRVLKIHPNSLNKTLDYFESLDTNETNKTSVNDMMNRLEKYANVAPSDSILYPDTPSIPSTPRHFQYLKQRLTNLRHQTTETQNDPKPILRTSSCNKPKKCIKRIKANNSSKVKTPNNKLNSINKITQITPEVDMLQNVESMLKLNGFPIARSREDDLDLYVRILKDMVKMDNGALEEYDWLGTTVSVQSAIAKLRSIIDQKKSGQRIHIHPYDLQLFKYVEELYTIASELTKEREGETLDEHIEDSKEDSKVSNNERTVLPKTHRKIKNPWKVLMQISDLMKKKVLRNKAAQRTKKFEVFLDCLQQCLDDFHTAIKELTRIIKYKNQRWYKNIKELYLAAGADKEYLEVLLHLYSVRLFTLIEESAKNGAEVDYRMYMKENRIEVDRAGVEMMFIIRILKTIHDIRMD